MAKIKWYSYLLNEEGQPISGASISIYLANSTTPAAIYTSETGTTATSAVPQLTTDADGYFEFWLGYAGDAAGYDYTQKFKIAWSKTGVTDGYNDYLSIVPPTAEETWEPVNEEGFDTTRNKTVSDNLARGWEDHRTNLSYYVHGISAVDTNNTDTTKNALVSNNLAKGWEDHKNNETYFVHGLSAVDETDTDTTYNKLVNNALAKGWEDHKDDTTYYVHGIQQVDETDTDTTINKLVSNDLAKGWEDHKDDMTYYVHGISAIDVNDPTDTTRNRLISNSDYNSLLTQIETFSLSLSSSSLSASGSEYYMNIAHGLNDNFPTVTIWNTTDREVISPSKIESIDINEIRIWLADAINFYIVVRGA